MNETELTNLSVTTMLEWVGCDAFRERTKLTTLLEHTSIGSEHFALSKVVAEPGSSIASFDALMASRRSIEKVIAHMVSSGWLKPSNRPIGRPRTRVFTDTEELQAIGRYELNTENYRAYRLSQAQPSTRCYVTLTDDFYAYLAVGADGLELEGLTRDDVATKLGISRKLTNRLVRELRKHGFAEVKKQKAGVRQNVLTKVSKNV